MRAPSFCVASSNINSLLIISINLISSLITWSLSQNAQLELDCTFNMFQVFHMFYKHVASVSYGYCKSRSGCCICCNGCTCMLHMSIPKVSSVSLDVCCKCVYLDVAYISHICCKYFILMLCMFAMIFKCFQVFFVSV